MIVLHDFCQEYSTLAFVHVLCTMHSIVGNLHLALK